MLIFFSSNGLGSDVLEAKMMNPAIQNDFSYYRRVLGRMKDKKQKMKVDEELANKMSFFFAYPTPMMKVMIDSTTSLGMPISFFYLFCGSLF
jgi:hypothetical protein